MFLPGHVLLLLSLFSSGLTCFIRFSPALRTIELYGNPVSAAAKQAVEDALENRE